MGDVMVLALHVNITGVDTAGLTRTPRMSKLIEAASAIYSERMLLPEGDLELRVQYPERSQCHCSPDKDAASKIAYTFA